MATGRADSFLDDAVDIIHGEPKYVGHTSGGKKLAVVSPLLASMPRLTCAPLGIFETSAFSAYLAAFAAFWMFLESSLFRKANLPRQMEKKEGRNEHVSWCPRVEPRRTRTSLHARCLIQPEHKTTRSVLGMAFKLIIASSLALPFGELRLVRLRY